MAKGKIVKAGVAAGVAADVERPVDPSPVSRGEGEKAPEAAEDTRKHVKASTEDQQIVEWEKQGFELLFDFEDFRELDGTVLDQLSRVNLDRYFVESKLYRRRLKSELGEAEYGKRLNIEVLGGSVEGRLRIEGLPKDLHPHWALPEQVHELKQAGFITVDSRFPEVVAGDKVAGGARKIMRSDGQGEELVLMVCPKEDHEARMQGNSDKSRERTKQVANKFDESAHKADKHVVTRNPKTIERVTMKG